MKNTWVRLVALLLLILTIHVVGAFPAHALNWVKTLDGSSIHEVTRELCDTIIVVDNISSDPQMTVTLTDEWNPAELALLDYDVTAGTVSTASGFLEWSVTATTGSVSMTKWFHVEQSTWSQTILQETLTPAEGSQLTQSITVNKYLPVLWIDSSCVPLVYSGESAVFAIQYGNTGGYENSVMIRSVFPPQALYASANFVPDRKDPAGTWAEWDVGDLAEGSQSTIQVTVAIAPDLPPSTEIEISSGIYNHVDDQQDTTLTKFATPSVLSQSPNQMGAYYSDAGCDSCASGSKVRADNFILDGPRRVKQIVIWGGYHPGNTPLAVDNFTVRIHQDNEGIPGTVVYCKNGIVPAERTDTGVNLFGVDEYRFTLNLPNPSTLPAGTYWVEIFNDTTSITDDFFWETGTPDAINGITGSVYALEAPGTTWLMSSSVDLALLINAIPPKAMPGTQLLLLND
jgi:hypothetical protein